MLLTIMMMVMLLILLLLLLLMMVMIIMMMCSAEVLSLPRPLQATLSKTEKMVTRSFDMLQEIIAGYFPLAAEQFFSDLVNALAAYASAKRLGDISPFAIKSIRVCADKLAQGTNTQTHREGERRSWEL